MKRILIGAIAGGLVMFVWGMISWWALPWHNATMNKLPQEDSIVQAMAAAQPKEGMYFFPFWPTDQDDKEAMEAFEKRHKEGPTGMVVYEPEGSSIMDPMVLLRGAGLNIAAAFLASLVLAGAGAIGYTRRVLLVSLMGVFAGVAIHGMYWNYMNFPADWTIVMIADTAIGWVLAGIVIAKFVKNTE